MNASPYVDREVRAKCSELAQEIALAFVSSEYSGDTPPTYFAWLCASVSRQLEDKVEEVELTSLSSWLGEMEPA